MIDKCLLCLGYNCKAAEYMTTASVCWLQNGIFCPWQQWHTFVWLFGGEGCTPPPPCWCWNGHFVFVYLMWAVKLHGRDKGNCPIEQQQQLSVCLPIHVFMVHLPPDANCVAENVCSVWIWVHLDWHNTSYHLKMPGMSVIHAFDMCVSGINDFLKQITSKYWHQADCLVYNLNFSVAHFLLQHALSDGCLAYIFLICKKSWLNVC